MVKARGWITAKTNEFKQNYNIKRNEQKLIMVFVKRLHAHLS